MPPKIDYAEAVQVDCRKVLETELDRAVDDALPHALANPGYGILVTRRTPWSFTVELSTSVPQGIIGELDLMEP